MSLHVQTSGEPVEAQVNGVPVLRLPAGAGSQSVAVHEHLVNGSNRISLVIGALPPTPPVALAGHPAAAAAAAAAGAGQLRIAQRPAQARARLVLLRRGKSLADEPLRVLAEVPWAVQEGDRFEAPCTLHQDLDLPLGFPRWRWLDAPLQDGAPQDGLVVLATLQRLAFDLSRGQPDSLLAACRLKLEELDQAYQTPPGHAAAALRAQVQRLWEGGTLRTLEPPTALSLCLRAVAGGRLVECLNPSGQPVLCSRGDGPGAMGAAWPLRCTLIDGTVYVLR